MDQELLEAIRSVLLRHNGIKNMSRGIFTDPLPRGGHPYLCLRCVQPSKENGLSHGAGKSLVSFEVSVWNQAIRWWESGKLLGLVFEILEGRYLTLEKAESRIRHVPASRKIMLQPHEHWSDKYQALVHY
ncbi:MAG: hypothetical protein HON43_01680 [Alphaproteobacteria bacterium]|jgi:hypothetical protein|nr:hypothetical protein [Alphaproteobacteria bacterium]MBT5390621.1 hypothetical protein [Alphaproteobacteria bacterium]MBT5540785.1 hypothetical protein [Alphaproteobacteria bacterium]